MAYPIDTASYNKAASYPSGHGYVMRSGAPSSIVVHSTEGAVGQSLSSAANYLYTAAGVSAHYLIGKQSEIIEFLKPGPYEAWHAGGQQANGTWTAQPEYANPRSIGIECLHASGESWPAAQKDALGWLLQQLCKQHAIKSTMIDTHGQIAIAGPYQRKVDPTNWPRPEFLAWRDALFVTAKQYRVMGLPVYQQSDHTGPLWGYLAPGQTVVIDDPNNGHVSMVDGVSAGIGFVDLSGLTPS